MLRTTISGKGTEKILPVKRALAFERIEGQLCPNHRRNDFRQSLSFRSPFGPDIQGDAN